MKFLKRLIDRLTHLLYVKWNPAIRFHFVLTDSPSEEEQIEMVKTYVPEAEFYSLYDAYTIALCREWEAVKEFLHSVEG